MRVETYERIFAIFQKHKKEFFSIKELSFLSGFSNTTVSNAVEKLIEEGKVRRKFYLKKRLVATPYYKLK